MLQRLVKINNLQLVLWMGRVNRLWWGGDEPWMNVYEGLLLVLFGSWFIPIGIRTLSRVYQCWHFNFTAMCWHRYAPFLDTYVKMSIPLVFYHGPFSHDCMRKINRCCNRKHINEILRFPHHILCNYSCRRRRDIQILERFCQSAIVVGRAQIYVQI